MEKRESARAIIFRRGQIVVMYREKSDRVYFTFPGGGRQEGESLENCVKREVYEEFGITVEPIREVYFYEGETTLQHFFLCEWTDGDIGTGDGEEFLGDSSRGIYIPMRVDIERLTKIPLMPPEVTKALSNDIKTFGEKLGEFKTIKAENV